MSALLVASKVTVEQAEWLWFRGLGLPGGLVFCLLSLFYPRSYAAMYLSLVGSQKGSVHISVTSCSRIVFVYEFCNIIIPRLIPQNGSTDGGEDPFFLPLDAKPFVSTLPYFTAAADAVAAGGFEDDAS